MSVSEAKRRYDEKNPVISSRLTKKLKNLFDDFKEEGESNPDAMIRIIEMIKKIRKLEKKWFEKGKDKGYQEGFEKGNSEGKKANQIWYYCIDCGKRICIEPDSKAHDAVIEYMKDRGWGHYRCSDKNNIDVKKYAHF